MTYEDGLVIALGDRSAGVPDAHRKMPSEDRRAARTIFWRATCVPPDRIRAALRRGDRIDGRLCDGSGSDPASSGKRQTATLEYFCCIGRSPAGLCCDVWAPRTSVLWEPARQAPVKVVGECQPLHSLSHAVPRTLVETGR